AGPRVASERPVVVACVGVLGPVGRRRVVLLLVRAEQRGHHDVGAGGGRDRALVIGVVAVPAAHQLHVRREQRGRGGPGLWGGLGVGARLRQGVQRWCRFRRQALVLLVVGGLPGARIVRGGLERGGALRLCVRLRLHVGLARGLLCVGPSLLRAVGRLVRPGSGPLEGDKRLLLGLGIVQEGQRGVG